MSEFKSDVDGFLIGESIAEIKRSSSIISRIELDVAAIKNAVIGSNKISKSLASSLSAKTQSINSNPNRTSTPDRVRDGSGRFVKGAGKKEKPSMPSANNSSVSKDESQSRSENRKSNDHDDKLFDGLGNKIVSAVTATTTGVEDIDPSVRAMHEVATPLIRGYQILSGDGKQKVNIKWFSRIFKELSLFRKVSGTFDKAANKTLKDIDVKTNGGGDGTGALMTIALPLIAGAFAKFMPATFRDFLAKNETLDKTITAVSDGMTWLTTKNETLDAGVTWLTSKNDTLDKIITGISTIGEDVTKAISDVFDPIKKWISDKLGIAFDVVKENLNDASNYIKGATGIDIPGSVSGMIDKVSGYVDSARDFTSNSIIQPVADTYNKMSNSSMRKIDSLSKTEGKTRVYKNSDGTVETRKGGTVSWRNNNPGNLKLEYAGSADKSVRTHRTKAQALASAQKNYSGVVDLDQYGNAIFDTVESGRNAQASLLKGKHKNKTIEQMLPGYAVNDYSGSANHSAYAGSIHKLAESRGLNLKGRKISDFNKTEMDALLDGMKKVESFKEGTVSIDKIPNINTASSQSYSPRIPKVNSAIKTQPIQDSPFILDQLNTNKSNSQKSASIDSGDVGQDVSNRRIAHIVTGGYSGA